MGEVTEVTVRSANEASCEEIQRVLGQRGGGHDCQCQRYRLERGESFAHQPVEERRARLEDQTACGDLTATTTSGLVAWLGEEPVGWCAVAPRSSYAGLVRNANQTAWRGRDEDRGDDSIWAVTCVLIRAGFRGRGVSRALARAAVEFARERGAGALEAYPVTVPGATWGEAHPGALGIYLDAGFEVVHTPSPRRAVVRHPLTRVAP